jgi:hypothetical protein
MHSKPKTWTIRSLLLLAALTGVSTMSQANTSAASAPAGSSSSSAPSTAPAPLPSDAEGFAFLGGHWKVQHRKLQNPWANAAAQWKDFQGTARFHTILNGLGSVEELLDDKGQPFGGALRMFDRERRVWTDSWIPYRSGVVSGAVEGRFVGATGTFDVEDELEGKPMVVRGVWVRQSPTVVTWEQLFSRDKGKTWLSVWQMRFEKTRAPATRPATKPPAKGA